MASASSDGAEGDETVASAGPAAPMSPTRSGRSRRRMASIMRQATNPFLDACSPTAAAAAGLLPPLEQLHSLPLAEQLERWIGLAKGLGPFNYTDPRTDWDATARYFDGTSRGIRYLYMTVAEKRGGVMDAEGIYVLIAEHFGFLQEVSKDEAMELEVFRSFCELVLGDEFEVDTEVWSNSFAVAIRFLRTAALLEQRERDPFQGGWTLYCYDYDEEHLSGSFVKSSRMRKSFSDARWARTPALAKQIPCGDKGSGYNSVDEFIISDPRTRQARVRWVHAVRPAIACRLALGQQYHLRVHSQLLFCRLKDAQPQAEISKGAVDWSSVVFPAAYIDSSSRASYDRYLAWYHQVAGTAKDHGVKHENLDQFISRGMPSLRLGIVQVNLMIFWSREEDNIVFSCAAAPKYLAKWSTPTSDSCMSWLGRLRACAFALATCCGRRARKGGYQPLATSEEAASEDDLEAGGGDFCEDEDNELDDEDLIRRMFKQHELISEAEASTEFEKTFSGVLGQISESKSVLRMGTHTQLALRMMLNRSADYLDIIALYTAAINHLRELLVSQKHGQEDLLIAKISVAKRELESLLKSVEPVLDNVIPILNSALDFEAAGDAHISLAIRLCRHHKFDMQNNFTTFIQQSRTQIRLCESILADYDRQAQDQVNNILNFLTLITFLIMPTQILTGLYGMNFSHMPELRWKYGYQYFFTCAAIGTAIFALILACLPRARQR